MRLAKHPITAVCTPLEAKRAALLFDEVNVAIDVSLGDDSLHRAEELFVGQPKYVRATGFSRFADSKDVDNLFKTFFSKFSSVKPSAMVSTAFGPPNADMKTLISIAQILAQNGRYAIPLYQSHEMLEDDISSKEHKIYRIVLERLPLVDPNGLGWQQVTESRTDPELNRRFRDLRLWMQAMSKEPSVHQIADTLDQRIDLYHSALRKHGIKTISGALTVFVDPAKLASASAAITGAAVLGSLELATVTGAIILAAQSALRVAEYLVGTRDVRAQYPEVALIHDIAGRAEA